MHCSSVLICFLRVAVRLSCRTHSIGLCKCLFQGLLSYVIHSVQTSRSPFSLSLSLQSSFCSLSFSTNHLGPLTISPRQNSNNLPTLQHHQTTTNPPTMSFLASVRSTIAPRLALRPAYATSSFHTSSVRRGLKESDHSQSPFRARKQTSC